MLFALYFGGFGATLLADPGMYFGGGALPYWTTPLADDAADIQNRMFGAQLLGIGIMAFLHGGEALIKKLVFFTMLITIYPMYLALAKETRAPHKPWSIQSPWDPKLFPPRSLSHRRRENPAVERQKP